MKEIQEFTGMWYLPDKQDNPVAGILHYNKKEKILLELIGSLSHEDNPVKVFFDDESIYQSIIYGESSDGKKITLVDCTKGPQSYNLSCRFPLTSFNCQCIIVGTHLTDKDQKCFNRINVTIPIMSQWIYPSLIEKKICFENEKPMRCQINIPFEQKLLNEINLNNHFKLLLKSGCAYNESPNRRDLKVDQFTYFEVESIDDEKCTFQEFLEQAYLFIHFLSLASLNVQSAEKIYLYDYDDFQNCNGEKFFNPIEFLTLDRNKDSYEEKDRLFFKYKRIENEFPGIIRKWFLLSKDLAPIRNHLLSSIQWKPAFTSLDFLIVVQSLEGYHRRFVEFNKSGRIYLRERLEHLIQIYSPEIQKIKNIDLQVAKVVDSRDYYSHFFKRNEKAEIVDGLELFELTKKLKLLLICCVLDLVGFSRQKIDEIIKINSDL
jgi:hypothetical protein